MNWTRMHAIVAGAAVIVLANAIALGGAALNRSGTPESVLRLTERELRPEGPADDRDNSGLALHVEWRVLVPDSPGSYYWGSAAPWLDRQKMASLGFDMESRHNGPREAFANQLSREVFLALEFDGEAAKQAAEQARDAAAKERAKGTQAGVTRARDLEEAAATGSRLFAVDAGLDADALRSHYPDRTKYAIVRGRVMPWTDPGGARRGAISSLLVEEINVPYEDRPVFEGAARRFRYGAQRPPNVRYEVTVAFGRRLEPSIVAAKRP